MKHNLFTHLPAAALVLLGLASLPGCGKATEMVAEELAEKAIENEYGGNANVDINSEDGKITMTTGVGENSVSVQAGESIALPDNLPADIPLPDGVTWHMVQNAQGEKDTLILQGTVETPLAELAATLKTQIEANGWESIQNISHGGTMEMMTYSKGDQTLSYNLANDSGKTTIMISKS